jgi:hypothetical protein
MMNDPYKYSGPLNGGYAIQDKSITNDIANFCKSTNEWNTIFAANGVTAHKDIFIKRFRHWISKTRLNSIQGLDQFPYATQTNGTTEAFTMFMMRHNKRKFKFFKGDFMMHKVASNIMGVEWEWIYTADQVDKDSAVIISCPFSDLGDMHPEHKNLMHICSELNVPVLVDMAYFGMCYGIQLDLTYSCIEEVTFSLGKTFPIIGMRAGIRFQRNEIDDPVLFANQNGIVNNFAGLLGIYLMKNYDPDFIPNKYIIAQTEVCNKLNIRPTKCVIFALSNSIKHKQFNRGNPLTRLCISKLLEEQYGN